MQSVENEISSPSCIRVAAFCIILYTSYLVYLHLSRALSSRSDYVVIRELGHNW